VDRVHGTSEGIVMSAKVVARQGTSTRVLLNNSSNNLTVQSIPKISFATYFCVISFVTVIQSF
jgi:hypothetical protein